MSVKGPIKNPEGKITTEDITTLSPDAKHLPYKNNTYKLSGIKESVKPDEVKTRHLKIDIKAKFLPGMARGEEPLEKVDVANNDMIEIEFDDGEYLWMSGQEYTKILGGQASRQIADTSIMEVPAQLDLLPGGLKERGVLKWSIKSLKLIGIDLEDMSAQKIAELIENHVPKDNATRNKRPGPGLFRCNMVTGQFFLEAAKPENVSKKDPILIFIHGTGSSTWGSFGDLWSQENKSLLDTLHGAYGNRVLAFEHASLTKSPIENALELIGLFKASNLPKNARLHLVTHSRGGLVGELLCRGIAGQNNENVDGEFTNISEPFEQQEFQLIESNKNLFKSLEILNEELKNKNFRIERFVRVACPALGTTLASGRLNRWLSIFGTICRKATRESPLADFFLDIVDFIAAVIKEGSKAEQFAGLEAMMPDSTFIKMVNWPQAKVEGDLVVIAGDIEPTAWWAQLMVWITDRFYEGDHDLVVNTPSMFGGVKRSGQSLVSFHKGPGINHFKYFENDGSVKSIVNALTVPDLKKNGFQPLQTETVYIARGKVVPGQALKPVVFILPGMMGSELRAGENHIWIDIPELIFGGLKKLHIDEPGIQPIKPFIRYYGELIEFLKGSHHVVPFPFDWRLPIEQEADRLAEEVQNEFQIANRKNQPVRFLAHSMGGLVVRAMMARHKALWQEICEKSGARFIMLGTPNRGSYSIAQLLVGESAVIGKLCRLDIINNKKELLKIIGRFPGLLAMLPQDGPEDFFSLDIWKQSYAYSDKQLVLPQAEDLIGAGDFCKMIEEVALDPEYTRYVAGVADVTVNSMDLSDSKLQFWATTKGDGIVTWESGIPAQVPTWYMDIEHGDLANHPPSFPALLQLLEKGTTKLLQDTPPVPRTTGERFLMPPPSDDLYPNEDRLIASVLGAGSRKNRQTKQVSIPIRIRVVHGNLKYTSNPVIVGHYEGDSIVSAEKCIDNELLDGALSRRLQLGLYPGKIGTNAIFINPKSRKNSVTPLKAAIVVGLGTVGSLNAATLTRSVTSAMLEYAIAWGELCREKNQEKSLENLQQLKFTTLLIGTHAGGISISDSIFALLQSAKQANQSLTSANHPQRIDVLEFIELWEDRALQAVKSVNEIMNRSALKGGFNFDGVLASCTGGSRRLTFDEPAGWWQRLQILGGIEKGERLSKTLRFSATTKRARNEVRLLATQRELVDRFVEKSIRNTHDDRGIARTLFELLLPNELKEAAPDQDDLILLIDEEAAQYPWELLEDPASLGNKPMVIEHGLLRQLESSVFRESVSDVKENTALVIGDPRSSYPELKGAQQEAKQVCNTLRSSGTFQVEHLHRPNSEQVINVLFEKPYRILHLAGHGVYRHGLAEARLCKTCGQDLPKKLADKYEEQFEPVTGMIIGDKVVLSPKEVHQMRRVPELVFINCCYLGYTESDDSIKQSASNLPADYNRIAANVATEFIRMGVRAVIAAGWAVNDDAAATFAITFYTEMLNRQPFGKAVKEAREKTFQNYPGINTWGAYQCYGDPDYRLSNKRRKSDQTVMNFISSSEMLAEINNIKANLESKGIQDPKPEINKLNKMEDLLNRNPQWQHNGQLRAAIGRAFGEAEEFDKAIECLALALTAEDALVTLQDLEQLSNFEVRFATQMWIANKNKDKKKIEYMIERAIDRLKTVSGNLALRKTGEKEQSEHEFGQTSERLSLLGSAYKRWAQVNESIRNENLRKMYEFYKKAYELTKERGKIDAYPLLNLLTADLVIHWQPKTPKQLSKQQFFSLIATARSTLQREIESTPNFWSQSMYAEIQLIELLAKELFDKDSIKGIVNNYNEVKKLGSPRQFKSVLDQIDFLIEMSTNKETIKNDLKKLRQKLI